VTRVGVVEGDRVGGRGRGRDRVEVGVRAASSFIRRIKLGHWCQSLTWLVIVVAVVVAAVVVVVVNLIMSQLL